MTERERILAEAKRIKREIEIDLNTIAYWNAHVRRPDEAPIEPDPNGTMRSCLAYCDGILNGDVHLRPEDGTPARRDRDPR